MVAGLGGTQVGQVLKTLWQYQRDKTAAAIGKGDIVSMDASKNWETATAAGGTHINIFSFAPEARISTDPKVLICSPESVVIADVVSGGTATPGTDAVISATAGKIKDRAAEAANKVVGTIIGTIDSVDGKVVETPITGPNPCVLHLAPWRYV
jgi:hypothetical protein